MGGKPIASALGLDPEDDAEAIKGLIKKLVASGVLRVVQGRDRLYKDCMYVVVA